MAAIRLLMAESAHSPSLKRHYTLGLRLQAIIFIPTDDREQTYLFLVVGIVAMIVSGQIAGAVAYRRHVQAARQPANNSTSVDDVA